MTDRARWDARYATGREPASTPIGPPTVFAPYAELFPTSGHGLELACGSGAFAVWLARRGVDVWGVDVSPVAIAQARELAERSGAGDRCRFDVVDLGGGLPDGPPVDVITCHLFRDGRLDAAIVERLAPGGLLAIATLSTVGARSGRFRAEPGELVAAFRDLDVVAHGEGEGRAWVLGFRRRGA